MGPPAQAFLNVFATSAALLGGKARRHSHHHVTGALSLIREDVKEHAPTGVVNALGKRMVLHHPRHVQVFDTDTAVVLRILFGRLAVEVTSLAAHLHVFASHVAVRLTSAVTALLAAAHSGLRPGKPLLAAAIVTRVLHAPAPRVGQKHL